MVAAPTRKPAQRGFVLIVTAIALAILLGLAVFGIDLGRMYVIKSELQAFTDSAALTAAMEMDGTADGLARARDAAKRPASGENAMRWDMGSKPIESISSSFAKGDELPDPKSWQATPQAAGDYRFVRVTASASAPVIFLRVFEPLRPDASLVAASSVAIQADGATRLVE